MCYCITPSDTRKQTAVMPVILQRVKSGIPPVSEPSAGVTVPFPGASTVVLSERIRNDQNHLVLGISRAARAQTSSAASGKPASPRSRVRALTPQGTVTRAGAMRSTLRPVQIVMQRILPSCRARHRIKALWQMPTVRGLVLRSTVFVAPITASCRSQTASRACTSNLYCRYEHACCRIGQFYSSKRCRFLFAKREDRLSIARYHTYGQAIPPLNGLRANTGFLNSIDCVTAFD